jgi:hypothetical protein
MGVDCNFNQEFDTNHMYQYVNNEISVMHCHHYATLFTRLAIDMDRIGGTRFLTEAMEESSYLTLHRAFLTQNLTSKTDKAAVAEQYFGLSGLGKLELEVGGTGGKAKMIHSHVDEGWIKKWKKEDREVNYIGQGYIAAAFSIINGNPVGYYQVKETKSIVKGDACSEFSITAKER